MDADEPISVTVDASDLTGASAEPLRSIISRYGRPVAARAFADFQQTSLSELAVQLYQMGFTLVHCPTWPNGDGSPKSVVSDILAQDLRDQLEELEGVETFLVVATNREYIAVANALRRHDKRVVIVAEEAKVARELRLCADEFAVLPPTKAERPATVTRAPRPSIRSVETSRQERVPEVPRVERAPEPVKVEPVRPEPVRPEPVRPERVRVAPVRVAPVRVAPVRVEPVRVEPVRVEPVRVERIPEPARPERVVEPAKAESADQVRLPSDSEVLTEVRKIVAAEGICTPRRLARALCPVDRTPTGELRSRIANRIQSLVDSGKLIRDRLVVGGTSVETIVVGDDRNGRVSHAAAVEAVSPAQPAEVPSVQPADPRSTEVVPLGGDGAMQGEVLPDEPVRPYMPGPREERFLPWSGRDLDTIVESVLRGPEVSAPLVRAEPEVSEPEQAREPELVAATAEAEPPAAEAPKRSRPRRRTPTKKAVVAPEPEVAG